jgi:hypothetical protein
VVTVAYSADLTAGSLKIRESRVIADLLLQEADDRSWERAVYDDNLLQARNSATARRITRLIRKRLELMGPELWRLVRDGSSAVATHAVLAAAVKHSQLLGDFLDTVVREQFRLFSETLPKTLFDGYLQDCRSRDPEMPEFTESTCRKLQTTVYHILVQAGFLSDNRKLRLQPVHIAGEVVRYLEEHDEDYVLRCIQVSP